MAIDLIQPDDLNNNKKPTPGIGAPVPTSTSNASTAPTVAGGANAPSSSGRFTNIQNVIRANQGNRLGSTVAGGVSGQAQTARTGIQNAQQQFGTASQAGNFASDTNKQKVQQLLTDPTQASDQDVTQFGQFRTLGSSGYKGPNELQDVGTLRGQAQRAEQLGQEAGTSGGRQDLLRQFASNGGQYSQGQQRLDTLLLDPRQLQAARQQTHNISNTLEQQNQAAQNQAQQLRGEAQKFTEDTQKQLEATQGQALTPVQQRLQEDQKAEADRATQFQQLQDLLSGNLSGVRQGDLSVQDIDNASTAAGDRSYAYAGNTWGSYDLNQRAGREIALNRLVQQGSMTPAQANAIRDEARSIERDKRDYRFATDQGAQTAQNLKDQNLIKTSGGFTGAQLSSLMGRRNMEDTNYDPNSFLKSALENVQGQNLTTAGVATDAERAKLNALQRLAGQTQSYNGDQYQAGKLDLLESPDDILKRLQSYRAY